MDQIPVEVLKIIFDCLPIDQLDECRKVCKKWLFTIEQLMNFDCLVVFREFLPVNQTYFHTNEKISLRHRIRYDAFAAGRSEFKKRIYRQFRRICLYDHFDTFRSASPLHCEIRRKTFFNVSMVNHLSQLEELHLWTVINADCRLSMPNLKTFKMFYPWNGLTLDAPQLTNLSLIEFVSIKLLYPETIETLECKRGIPVSGPALLDLPYFCEFFISLKGLKYLWIESLTSVDLELVREYKVIEFLRDRLKELHYFKVSYISRDCCQVVRELKEQANGIQIYFNGLEVDCLRDLLNSNQKDRNKYWGRCGLVTSDQQDFYWSNSSALSERLPLHEVNYNLIEVLGGSGLELFSSRKLSKLRIVTVNEQVKDERAFGRWLSGSATLFEIIFECALSQDFYSTILPASCPTLQCLNLLFDTPLDFSFLLKLKFLYRVDLRSSDYGLVELLFSNSAYLRYLEFYERNSRISTVSLGVIKREKEKKLIYEVYDHGQVGNETFSCDGFKPKKIFQSFESLIEFTKQFTGF